MGRLLPIPFRQNTQGTAPRPQKTVDEILNELVVEARARQEGQHENGILRIRNQSSEAVKAAENIVTPSPTPMDVEPGGRDEYALQNLFPPTAAAAASITSPPGSLKKKRPHSVSVLQRFPVPGINLDSDSDEDTVLESFQTRKRMKLMK